MSFFFFNVEIILSVKKCKKVIFKEKRLKKLQKRLKRADNPLKLKIKFWRRDKKTQILLKNEFKGIVCPF